jgi:hypothetical protein
MTGTVEVETGGDVLAFARASRAAANRADADVLLAAVAWAERHPAESISTAATWGGPGGDCPVPLAGEGAPLVSEFCIAEFAVAIGRSTEGGRATMAHGLELKYRLPRHWARVQGNTLERTELEPWRACRIANATIGLSQEAASYVDAQLVGVAHKVGTTKLDRLIEIAIDRFMPETARENAEKAAEDRHVTFFHHQISSTGTTHLQADLDLADALDLDAAITAEAEALHQAGSKDSLDVRRAIAAGRIARRLLGLPTEDATGDAVDGPDKTAREQRTARPVVLYVHLSQAALTGDATGELAQVENHHRTVLAEQVRAWCANTEARIIIKPVLDLEEHIGVAAYEVPARLSEQTALRDGTCAFPWCQRPATSCDRDHTIAHAAGGPTCSCNIAPLCRRHHRLKTHSPWTYTAIDPGTYLWTSPHGYQLLRDRDGTTDITHHRPPPAPSRSPDG